MSKKLFVGRLPFDFTNEKLETLFAPVGTVLSAIMIPDPKNGRSRGFGFVTMKTDEETAAAIQKLNGTRLGDKEIWVTEAKEKTPKTPKDSRDRRPPFRSNTNSFSRDRTPFERGPGDRKPFGRGPSEGPSNRASKPFRKGPTGGFSDNRPPKSDFFSRDRKPFGGTERGASPERRPNRFGPRPFRPKGAPGGRPQTRPGDGGRSHKNGPRD